MFHYSNFFLVRKRTYLILVHRHFFLVESNILIVHFCNNNPLTHLFPEMYCHRSFCYLKDWFTPRNMKYHLSFYITSFSIILTLQMSHTTVNNFKITQCKNNIQCKRDFLVQYIVVQYVWWDSGDYFILCGHFCSGNRGGERERERERERGAI